MNEKLVISIFNATCEFNFWKYKIDNSLGRSEENCTSINIFTFVFAHRFCPRLWRENTFVAVILQFYFEKIVKLLGLNFLQADDVCRIMSNFIQNGLEEITQKPFEFSVYRYKWTHNKIKHITQIPIKAEQKPYFIITRRMKEENLTLFLIYIFHAY